MFFFKQKTAYEMRISDLISDVCSSDLRQRTKDLDDECTLGRLDVRACPDEQRGTAASRNQLPPYRHDVARDRNRPDPLDRRPPSSQRHILHRLDRKSVVSGKIVSVRVDLGGRRIFKKKKKT